MENNKHINIFKKGVKEWNTWKRDNKSEMIDLSGIDLSERNLSGVDLSNVNLSKADLTEVDLSEANLSGSNLAKVDLPEADLNNANLVGTNLTDADLCRADLSNANLSDANLNKASLEHATLFMSKLSGANLSEAKIANATIIRSELYKAILCNADLSDANLFGSNLFGANLAEADLSRANLSGVDLTKADLSGADLSEAILSRANLSEAILMNADLSKAICTDTNFTNATIENAIVYGVSAWNIEASGLLQDNLVISRYDEPLITVDNIEVAQFIYLILNNEKIQSVISTVAEKGVLILGRFTPERKKILDTIREKLREHDLVPIMFDFEKVTSRSFTETIKILAGMSKFVIADITWPKSIPQELQATVPDYKIPFLPIIQKGEEPFAMFIDLQINYDWVLDLLEYESEEDLIMVFNKGILKRALETENKILREKQIKLKVKSTKDFKE